VHLKGGGPAAQHYTDALKQVSSGSDKLSAKRDLGSERRHPFAAKSVEAMLTA
jgi:hypothetical protein